MSSTMDRRSFLKAAGIGGATAACTLVTGRRASAGTFGSEVGTLVEIERCDGCADQKVPRCVAACRAENSARYPVVTGETIADYWPQPQHEDWRPKREATGTLTPYNWTFVQRVAVADPDGGERTLFIPRRCMHCDTPVCAALCPFGVIDRRRDGAVTIDPAGCMGGAKCRTVCPWGIPQRQAGVGIYLDLLPKFAGGGVMYKCDLCAPRLDRGGIPACVEACRARLGDAAPLTFGPRDEIRALARLKSRETGGHLYGDTENGGTGTVYLSPVPFAALDGALRGDEKERFRFPADPAPLDTANLLAEATLLAPVAAVLGAVLAGTHAVRSVVKRGDRP